MATVLPQDPNQFAHHGSFEEAMSAAVSESDAPWTWNEFQQFCKELAPYYQGVRTDSSYRTALRRELFAEAFENVFWKSNKYPT